MDFYQTHYDEYGIWTELDQDFAAAEMFRVLEKEEVAADNVNSFS